MEPVPVRATDSTTVVCATLSLLAAFAGCVVERRPIPIGAYANPSGDETISARESQLQFHIRVEPDHPERFVDRTYDYVVYKDGTLVPSTMTSNDAAFGVGRYEWRWDGEAIIRHDRRGGETVRFTPRRPPG